MLKHTEKTLPWLKKAMCKTKKKKVLIVKLASLGDVMATTPIFKSLHDMGFEVHHMVMQNSAVITKNSSYVTKQIIAENTPTDSRLKDVRVFLKLWFSLFFRKYEAVFIFHRSAALKLLIKSTLQKKVYSYCGRFDFLLSGCIKYDSFHKNRTLQEYEMVDKWTVLQREEKLIYEINAKNVDANLLRSLPQDYIVCNPGGAANFHASMPSRRLPLESYAKLLNELDKAVILVGSGKDDAAVSSGLMSLLTAPCISLIGQTNIDTVAAIIKDTKAYLGNDSFLGFLAVSLGVKTFIFFGPTPSKAALPLGSNCFAIEGDANCAPCYDSIDGLKSMAYRCEDNICMQNIDMENAVDFIKSKLSQ